MGKRKIEKKIVNSRLLKYYGSWLYCTKCNKTVAYICYTNYNYIKFSFVCDCGSTGFVELIDVENVSQDIATVKGKLEYLKNRLCCRVDKLPMFSVVKNQVKK